MEHGGIRAADQVGLGHGHLVRVFHSNKRTNILPSLVSVIQMYLCSTFPLCTSCEGVRPARGIDLSHGLVVDGVQEWLRECLEEIL
jgi:hypothetical protein